MFRVFPDVFRQTTHGGHTQVTAHAKLFCTLEQSFWLLWRYLHGVLTYFGNFWVTDHVVSPNPPLGGPIYAVTAPAFTSPPGALLEAEPEDEHDAQGPHNEPAVPAADNKWRSGKPP